MELAPSSTPTQVADFGKLPSWTLVKSALNTTTPDQPAYVLHILPHLTLPVIAVSSSDNTIKLYNPADLTIAGQFTGHESTITDVCFSPTEPHILFSSSYDSTIRMWDTRTLQQINMMRVDGAEIHSVSTLSSAVAGAAGSEVLVWDARAVGAPAGKRLEAHTQDVSVVRFRQNVPRYLFSGSVDETVCVFDIAQPADEELQTTLMVEQSVSKLGFFGDTEQFLWAITHTETLTLWNLAEEQLAHRFDSLREGLQARGVPLDYLLGCSPDPSGKLALFGGSFSGDLFVLAINGAEVVPTLHFRAGHTEVIRAYHWHPESNTVITGGEDSRLCVWKAPSAVSAPAPSADAESDSSSSTRKGRERTKNQFKPY